MTVSFVFRAPIRRSMSCQPIEKCKRSGHILAQRRRRKGQSPKQSTTNIRRLRLVHLGRLHCLLSMSALCHKRTLLIGWLHCRAIGGESRSSHPPRGDIQPYRSTQSMCNGRPQQCCLGITSQTVLVLSQPVLHADNLLRGRPVVNIGVFNDPTNNSKTSPVSLCLSGRRGTWSRSGIGSIL
jgi:hypothetical protein